VWFLKTFQEQTDCSRSIVVEVGGSLHCVQEVQCPHSPSIVLDFLWTFQVADLVTKPVVSQFLAALCSWSYSFSEKYRRNLCFLHDTTDELITYTMTCSRCSWPSLVPSMSIFLSTIPIGHSLSTEWDVRCWKVTWSVRGPKGLSWRRLDRASLFIFRGFFCNCYQFDNEYEEREILLYYGVCQIQTIVPGVRCLQKIWVSPLGASQIFLTDSKTNIINCTGMLHYELAFISICISPCGFAERSCIEKVLALAQVRSGTPQRTPPTCVVRELKWKEAERVLCSVPDITPRLLQGHCPV
jgi:hypothetical protein